jgi:plasmid replication initiation protein
MSTKPSLATDTALSMPPELVFAVQPTRDSHVWQQNRLAEARYKLNVREQKLLLYVISMIDPAAQDFGRCKVSVQGYAEMTGLQPDDLYQELRDTALSIREKTLVVEGVLEPGTRRPVKRHGSWFEYVDEAMGDGCVTIKLSSWLAPFLLQVRREFFKYKLNYALNLKSEYSIRLYQWLKRWQFAGRRVETIPQLRLQLGATEVDHEGKVIHENLAAYKHFKNKALTPALAEINARTDLSVIAKEEKIKGSKAVGAIAFTIRLNQANHARLDSIKLPERSQLELTLDSDPEVVASLSPSPPPAPSAASDSADEELIDAWMEEFGLSAHQRESIRERVRARGMIYVSEKAEIIRSAPRDNAARAFLAALKQDWKTPHQVKARGRTKEKSSIFWSEPAGWRAYLKQKYPEARLPKTYAEMAKTYPSLDEEVRRGLLSGNGQPAGK